MYIVAKNRRIWDDEVPGSKVLPSHLCNVLVQENAASTSPEGLVGTRVDQKANNSSVNAYGSSAGQRLDDLARKGCTNINQI